MLHSIYQQVWISSGHRTEKCQFSLQSQRKIMPKHFKTTAQLLSSHMLIMFKLLQVRFQWYMNQELPVVQAVLWKGIGTRDQISNICWIIEKAREFQKIIYFCFIDYSKAFDYTGSQPTVENSSKDGNTRPPYLPPEKSVFRSRSNS